MRWARETAAVWIICALLTLAAFFAKDLVLYDFQMMPSNYAYTQSVERPAQASSPLWFTLGPDRELQYGYENGIDPEGVILYGKTEEEVQVLTSSDYLTHLPILFTRNWGYILCFLGTLLLSLVFLGQMLCGFMCPLSLLQDLMDQLRKVLHIRPINENQHPASCRHGADFSIPAALTITPDNGQAVRFAQLVVDLPQKDVGIFRISELSRTIKIYTVKFYMRVEMLFVNMGRYHKLMPAAGEFHSQFTGNLMRYLRADFARFEGLDHAVHDYVALFRLASPCEMFVQLFAQFKFVGGVLRKSILSRGNLRKRGSKAWFHGLSSVPCF